MPLQDPGSDVLRQVEVLPHSIAIVVMRYVLSPVHQGRLWLLGYLTVVVGIYLFVAAIRLNHRGDEHDRVAADSLNEWSFFDDQPIREFHQHLWAAGLRSVDAACDPVDRLSGVAYILSLPLCFLGRAR